MNNWVRFNNSRNRKKLKNFKTLSGLPWFFSGWQIFLRVLFKNFTFFATVFCASLSAPLPNFYIHHRPKKTMTALPQASPSSRCWSWACPRCPSGRPPHPRPWWWRSPCCESCSSPAKILYYFTMKTDRGWGKGFEGKKKWLCWGKKKNYGSVEKTNVAQFSQGVACWYKEEPTVL